MVARGRTPAARFHRHVAGALARLDRQWHRDLARIEVRVEDVPTSDPASWEVEGVPLARSFSRSSGQKDRIVLYRRPIEARACDPQELSLLVLDILVEQVATVLGRSPEEIDPGYGR
jgi:predicted Zn-dependent protease with MMP-like domain